MSATTVSMSNCSRPQVGQAMSTGPRSRRCSALRISHPTLTSSSAWKVEREMRMVSPMPSASRVPSPTADFSDPDHLVPASVMPRCSGYGIRCDSRRLAAIVLGTFVDLMETLKSSKRRRSISSTNSTAAATSASTEFSRSSSCRCLGSEPLLTPMRIGVPAARARSATSATFSGPPMLPGFRRMQWAPASIAFRASVWLKWMSAMIGIGDSTTIVLSASMSSSRGTATRTTSAPASATVRIWSIVACKLAVSVFVIVCTTTGAPPPMGTPPTLIWRLEAMPSVYAEGPFAPLSRQNGGVTGPDVYASASRQGLRTRLASPLAARARSRRHAGFFALTRVTPESRIVDLGSGPRGLRAFAPELDVTGVDRLDQPYPGPFVQADVTARLPFEDGEFDLAYSSSLVEHLAPAQRAAFAAEVRRVARGWFVQTPAWSFPVEPHALLPFAHWLPPRIRRAYWRLGVAGEWEDIDLLGRRE